MGELAAELTLLGLTVSLDYKPNFNLVGRENWYQGQVGISVRKVLLSDKELKKEASKEKASKKTGRTPISKIKGRTLAQ